MRLQYTKAMALVDKDFSEEKEGLFKGYAASTGNIDRGNDIILKGAFTDSLAKTDPSKIRVLWQHSWDNPIGKTLSMSEDDNGLLVEGELLLDIERARDARTLIKNNAIDGLSIGFTVDDFSFEKKSAIDLSNEKVQAWEKLMWKYQQALPGAKPGEKWMLMEKIFQLS